MKVIDKQKIRNKMIIRGHNKMEVDLIFMKEIAIMNKQVIFSHKKNSRHTKMFVSLQKLLKVMKSSTPNSSQFLNISPKGV